MKFAIYSDVDERSIRANLGRPEYSYYFVLKSFRPALERIGTVVLVRDPAQELGPIFDDCATRGEPCLYISFTPPHKSLVDLAYPTMVVFAWEFSTIPNEAWDDDPRNDWRHVFARHGRAVTLSNHTARAVKAAMGEDFPILAVAAPVWDRFAPLRAARRPGPIIDGVELRLEGLILDSRTLDLSPDYLLNPEPPIPEPPQPEPVAAEPEPVAATVAEPEPHEPEPEPEPILEIAVAEIVAEAAIVEPPAIEAAPRKSLRYRLGVTKRHALEWYREAVRDLLPRWLVWIVSRIGRVLDRTFRLALGSARRPVAEPSQPTVPDEPILDAPAAEHTEAVASVEEVVPPEAEPDLSAPEPDLSLAEAAQPAPEVAETAIVEPEAPPPAAPKWPEARVTLNGVVYTSVLNPTDGRKNWWDLITGFCWAFRDTEDATLVLKMVQGKLGFWYRPLVQMLSQLSPFKCRIVVLHGYLEDEEYEKLIAATTYYANTSCCEGLCLPLMEFMSCRKPAVAPRHTALADYVDADNAFIVEASLEHNVWPHDPRDLFRTERYRIDWESVLHAYQDSYRVAKEEPARYAEMGEHASETMRLYSSDRVVAERLEGFIRSSGASRAGNAIPIVRPEPEQPEDSFATARAQKVAAL